MRQASLFALAWAPSSLRSRSLRKRKQEDKGRRAATARDREWKKEPKVGRCSRRCTR